MLLGGGTALIRGLLFGPRRDHYDPKLAVEVRRRKEEGGRCRVLCGGEVCQRCGEIRCCAGPCVVQGAMQAGVQCGGEVWKRYRAGFCAGWCGCCEAVAKSC